MPGWRWIATPGHAAGHVSLFREADRTLIAGDAFVTTNQESAYAAITQEPEMHGPPMYLTTDWQAAAASVRTLASLSPELVITGHGRAMHGSGMRNALRDLADNFERIAFPIAAATWKSQRAPRTGQLTGALSGIHAAS
jgi:glyoxylase-like metal-dependent hydrolase (beta-lactamase superfamily II)